MKPLKPEHVEEVSGGLEPHQYDSEVVPDPSADPNIVIDYNPPQQPQ